MTPSWMSALPLWVESGGVYAVAVLRGGNEFGERWHRDGMLERKQNVFDDFIAACEWVTREGYTSRERLAIGGGSNGGLLVGAVLTQRLDLCRAVVCEVPLLDMLRYHRLQLAKLWIPEYGSAENADQFLWLHAYSPYHRVIDGERYPAVLLTTALGDTRVDPMHARKMGARLQAATASDRPILVRVDQDEGHGVGKPRSKQLEAATDFWTFVFWHLGVKPSSA
jgi:prolyl oligopeptidase